MNAVLEKENVNNHKENAGFWIRFAAYLIDGIIIGIPVAILSVVIFMFTLGTSDAILAIINDPYLETESLTMEQEMDLVLRYIEIAEAEFKTSMQESHTSLFGAQR